MYRKDVKKPLLLFYSYFTQPALYILHDGNKVFPVIKKKKIRKEE